MKKEQKLWRVFVTRERRYEDYTDYKFYCKPLYRYGVSEKQVIARLRRTYDLYDHDEMMGQCAVNYIFDIEDAKPNGIMTFTVFDFEW